MPGVNPRPFTEVDCRKIDPTTLKTTTGTGTGTAIPIDLMQLSEPLVLRNCKAADSVFSALSDLIGTPSNLQRNFGEVDVNVYPTGPFHLQLGSSIIPIPKSGTIKSVL